MSRKRKSKRRNSRIKGQSVKTISVYAFLCFAITLIASNYIAQFGLLFKASEFRSNYISANADKVSAIFQIKSNEYIYILKHAVNNKDIQKLLINRNWDKLRDQENKLLQILPNVLSINILGSGYDSLNNKIKPNITYACLDLIHKAEKNNNISQFEFHGKNTEHAHIGIIHPVFDISSNKVIGNIRLTLKVDLIKKWLNDISSLTYFELIQDINKENVAITKNGDVRLRIGAATSNIAIDGTRWRILIWQETKNKPTIFNLFTLVVILSSLLIAGFTIFLISSSFSRTIKIDLENFMCLVTAVAKGNKTHEFKLKLKEFKQAALNVDNLSISQKMVRERDDDSENIQTSSVIDDSELAVSPLFISQASIAVEEIESDTFNAAQLKVTNTEKLNSNDHRPANFSTSMVEDNVTVIAPEIFKAYDIRGIVGTTITTEIIELIGCAIAAEALKRGATKIAFARDGRLSGPELGTALVKGLKSSGMKVIDIGMVPTPLLYFVANTVTNGTGIMLTGSHNPPNYNGVKMMIAGDTLSGDAIQSLYKRIIDKDFVTAEGSYETASVNDIYLKRVTDDVKASRKLRIVVDCGNGVAGVIAPTLYRKMGCEVIELFCDVDGTFPNHHPDPSQPKNLEHLIAAVAAQKADIGFAFDGDGDRLGVISGDGNIIWPDRLLMLFAADVLSRERGAKIIYDVKCSSNLTKAIWEKGGEPLMWKTGHSFIKAKMKESGALLAGEMSGHIFFKERWYGFDDALYSGARLIEILSKDVRKPCVILAGLPDMVNTPELQLKMAEGEHFEFMDKLLDSADFGSANVLMIDGIRADYDDGWGLVRASNTTPTLVFRFEGKDEAALTRIKDQFRAQVLAIKPNLKLPF